MTKKRTKPVDSQLAALNSDPARFIAVEEAASRGEILSGEVASEGQRKPFAREVKSGTVKFPDKDAILSRLELWLMDGLPLRQFCRLPGNPGKSSIHDWLQADPVWSGRVARAKDIGFADIAEHCLEIADDSSQDTTFDAEGNEKQNSEWIARSRLRVETRLKLLACWDPRRYGQKQQLEHSGKVSLESLVVGSMPEVSLAAPEASD